MKASKKNKYISSNSEKEKNFSINIKNKDFELSGKELFYLSNIAMFCSGISFSSEPKCSKDFTMTVTYDFSKEEPTIKDNLIKNLTREYKSVL